MRSCTILTGMAICLFGAAPSVAQERAVTVFVRMDSTEALEGALVHMIRQTTGERTSRVTNSAGKASLPVSAPGMYVFRVQRYGFVEWASSEHEIGARRDTTILLVVPLAPIPLDQLFAAGSGRCPAPPRREAAELVALYEATRRSLTAVLDLQRSLTFVGRLVREEAIPLEQWSRVRPMSVATDTLHVRMRNPMDAPPADSLVVHGFATPRTPYAFARYHALSPDVLISESFQLTHCFQRTAPREDGSVGLSFSPMDRTAGVDVSGTVWLDPEAKAVRLIDYRYTGLRRVLEADMPYFENALRERYRQSNQSYSENLRFFLDMSDTDQFGGAIRFETLPSGETVLSGWELRTPVLRHRSTAIGRGRGAAVTVRPQPLNSEFHVLRIERSN